MPKSCPKKTWNMGESSARIISFCFFDGMISWYLIARWWFGIVVSIYLIYWEKSSQLTNIFQRGWNHQPAWVNPRKSKNLIEKYHQWLLAESKETSAEMAETYDQKLKQVELQLAVADEKMAFSFPGWFCFTKFTWLIQTYSNRS